MPVAMRAAGDHARMAVPEARHPDAAQEVEVLVALGVPQARALAADELDRQARIGADHARALYGLGVTDEARAGKWADPFRMWSARQ